MGERELKIYFVSDMHGYFCPTTYADREERAIGWFSCYPQVEPDENTLLIDGGDTLQGSPFTTYCHDVLHSSGTVSDIMNDSGFQFVTLGNHDFNYGWEYLKKYVEHLKAVCVCQNVLDESGNPLFPWTVKTMGNGLRVGIVGVVTDFVTVWEKPEHLSGIRIADPFQAAKDALREMKDQVDLTLCIYHGGFEKDLDTGRVLSSTGENIANRICEELDFDIVLTGHQHMSIGGRFVGGTFTLQPGFHAQEIHFVDVSVAGNGEKTFSSKKLPALEHADVHLVEKYQQMEKEVDDWLDVPIGELPHALCPEEKLKMAVYGSEIADLFNAVQLFYSGAQISVTSLANDVAGFHALVTRRDVLASYPYSNTLMILKMTGRQLKTAMERTAEYFCVTDGQLNISEAFLRPKIEHYNYDYYAGVSYQIDVTHPAGNRIVSLFYQGVPVNDEDCFTVCVSNYRSSGTGGYDVYQECEVLGEIQQEVSDLIIQYIEEDRIGGAKEADSEKLRDFTVTGWNSFR